MARQDPVWDRIPLNYFEGPFVGNGVLGAILFQDKLEPNTLRFEIGRTDVYDHRTHAGSVMHYGCRLPIGHLFLKPIGTIKATRLRIDLWNAEINGQITTDKGVIKLCCFVPSESEVIIIQLTGTGLEKGVKISFVPEQGSSPRFIAQPTRDKNFTYLPNPPFELKQVRGIAVSVQPLLAESDYATAWKEVDDNKGGRTLYLSVANRQSRMGSETDAVESVEKAMEFLYIKIDKF